MSVVLISLQRELEAIGIKFLHYYLLANGIDSRLLFLPRFNPADPQSVQNAVSFVRDAGPGLVGIGVMSHEFFAASDLTHALKAALPSAKVVWGGIHATAAPEMCLQHADFACMGEGERSLLDLARDLDAGGDGRGVRNLCFMRDGRMVRNELYPLIENLDEIPPYEHKPRAAWLQEGGGIVPLNRRLFRKYSRHDGTTYFVLGSRGCPFACTYCCNDLYNRLYGSRKVRHRGVESLIDDIQAALRDNPEIRLVNFNDDCFLAADVGYLREFAEAYKSRIGKPFIVRSIPLFVTEEKIAILKQAGLQWLCMGLQSGSDRVCRDVFGRHSYSRHFIKAAAVARRHGVAGVYDVILDNPFESHRDMVRTVRTLMRTPKPFYPQLFGMTFFMGSELYERAKRECPELTRDSMSKDFFVYSPSRTNYIVKLAAMLPRRWFARPFLRFRRNPEDRVLKAQVFLAKLLLWTAVEPLTYFRVTRIACGGSFFAAAATLVRLSKVGLRRHVNILLNRQWLGGGRRQAVQVIRKCE